MEKNERKFNQEKSIHFVYLFIFILGKGILLISKKIFYSNLEEINDNEMRWNLFLLLFNL